jgi:predicted ATP-dependent endonuclease of OLD family
MKIGSIKLEHFKKFRDTFFNFTDEETGLARNLILLIGENGAGKTTILQAIAATLGTATGRLKSPSELDWTGFNEELLAENWKFEPSVTLDVQFSEQEIEAIADFYNRLKDRGFESYFTPPATEYAITLKWFRDKVQANTPNQLFQCKGRQYAKPLVKTEGFGVFEKVGDVFWYTEQRTSTSLTAENADHKLEMTYDKLRDRLSTLRYFHLDSQIKQLRPGQKDLYAEIERMYQSVFPQRRFEGSIPRQQIDDVFGAPWFYMYDGKAHYEISEMSAGERAIFPILFDFANWNIHNSVILLDEIELHLHPPLQQALLRALPKLGRDNQFIITTHSDHVEGLIPEAHIIRVDDKS